MSEVQSALVRAQTALRQSKIREIRKLAVEQVGEVIALHGHASSFYFKQLAQEIVRKELEGQEVLNHIQVAHLMRKSTRKPR